ncbi:MAG: DUF6498-containing protein [Phycisphaerae bacterium]|nr:DUF6498-containing protein [Phycisphaerae bacterium]
MFDILIWSVVIIIWALIEQWPPVVLMWVCWGQGICFGLFIFLRVLFVRQSSVWYKSARLTSKAFGFLPLNFFFYLAYIYFLRKLFENTDFKHDYIRMILIPIGIYCLTQLFRLIYRIVKGNEMIINQTFFDQNSFIVLLPMHIMIIGCGFLKTGSGSKIYGTGMLISLLVLKLLADTVTFVYSIRGFYRK